MAASASAADVIRRLWPLCWLGCCCWAALAVGATGGPVRQHWATPIFEDVLDGGLAQAAAVEGGAGALNIRLGALALELEARAGGRGERKSNAGGWQSAPLALTANPPLAELGAAVLGAARWFITEGLGDDVRRQRALAAGEYKLEVAAMWLNVNRGGDYNHAHIHTDSFLSGVYYVDPGPVRPSFVAMVVCVGVRHVAYVCPCCGVWNGVGDALPAPWPRTQAPHAELVLADPRVQIQQFEYMGWWGMGVHARVSPAPAKLVLFPSWLSHRVEATPPPPPAHSTSASAAPGEGAGSAQRISVSFNLRFAPDKAKPRPNMCGAVGGGT